MLGKWVNQLSQELGMENLTVSEDHRYHLPFNHQLEVEAAELDHSYLLQGVIGERPQQNGDAFLLKVMEANLFGVGTRGAVIGLNEDGKLLTLSFEMDYNSSYKDFKEKLEDFVSVMDFWRQEALKHQ